MIFLRNTLGDAGILGCWNLLEYFMCYCAIKWGVLFVNLYGTSYQRTNTHTIVRGIKL